MTTRSLALPLAILLTNATHAQNWPQFRGPDAGGIGTGAPPVTWNLESGKNVAWRVRVPGLGHASPIVWGGRVYVVTAISAENADATVKTGWSGGSGESPDETGAWSWQMLCYDLDSGRQLWQSKPHAAVPRIKRHLKATHANSTPATDGTHIVTFFGSEGLFCFDMQGGLVWRKDLGKLHAGPYNAPDLEWGFASSPIIVGDRVIVQCDVLEGGFWASFDLKTGKQIRRVARDDVAGWATPAVYRQGDRTHLVCNGFRKMAAYDLDSGAEIWTLSGGGDVPVPTPLVTDDSVLLTSAHGRSAIFVVDRGATGDLTPDGEERPGPLEDETRPAGLRWYTLRGGNYMPTPLILDGLAYFGDDRGILHVLDLRDYQRIHRERISDGVTVTASPVAADGRIYFTNEDGEVIVIRAGGDFEVLGRSSVNEVCMATPAISEGNLLIRGVEHLVCLRESASGTAEK